MDVIKRASFASKQVKAGPAPLASFEDLPSDELESPEEFSILRTNAIDSHLEETDAHSHQYSNPESLTISSQSTPQIDSDFDSHYTLTPGDAFEGQSTELRTASLSSLSKDEDATSLCVHQKKGSALSLEEYEAVDSEDVQRKSSWTDIFRSHNQNSAKSSITQSAQCDIIPEVKVKKKCRNEPSKKETEPKSKDKGKFLSLFKVGKKSPKNIQSPISPDNHIISSQTKITTEISQNIPSYSGKVSPVNSENKPIGKENELPQQIDSCPKSAITNTQNDLDKLNAEQNEKIPDERKLNRKNFNVTEKNYNILAGQSGIEKVSIQENIKPNAVDEELSESEFVFDVKDSSIAEEKEEEVDFEAETLLSQDEIDEDSSLELKPFLIETSKQIVIASRQQRLEITTKPIERPRSTTPINIAPLEAFIQSVSPTFDSKVEKIKLSLPGDQFIGRMKSPKKSCVKSWTDFCEMGLHSPRMPKRIDEDELLDPFNEGEDKNTQRDPFSEQTDSSWATFGSSLMSSETNVFGDNFTNSSISVDVSQANSRLSYHNSEVNISTSQCPCECHNDGCVTCPIVEENGSEGHVLCLCRCHQKSSIGNGGCISEGVSLKTNENFLYTSGVNEPY